MAGYTLPTYPFRTPPELAGGRVGRHPVVVVGGGLVGLTLALDLGLRGVPVVVLDEDDSVGAAGISSRGVVYVQRTLEIFQRLGVAGPVMAKGVGWHVGRVYQGDAEVYTFNAQAPGATQHPAHTNLQQFFVEQYLVERIADVPSVDLRWRNKLVRIEQDEEGVDIEVETPEGAYRLRTDWMAACDGGGSFVRRSLGVPTDTQRFEDQWCIADLRPEGGRPVERRMYLDAPFNQGGVVLNHQLADGVCRINCQISHYDDPEEAGTLPAIHRRVQQALGPGAAYELVWTGVWRFKRRITERFVDGRVMFVGDSAHELPPFGARGGNSGVADADNLGWKLAMVIRGGAAPALLHSYHAERYPAAVENIAVACRSARFLHPGTAGERLFRDAILALAHVHPRYRPMVNTGRLCGASHYPDSTLNGPDDWHGPGIAPGSPIVNGMVLHEGREAWLLDYLPCGFVTLRFAAHDAPLAATRPMTSELIVSRTALPGGLADPSGALFAAFGIGPEGATYLIRPDGYVMARARGQRALLPGLPRCAPGAVVR